jgi:hypothetical protein
VTPRRTEEGASPVLVTPGWRGNTNELVASVRHRSTPTPCSRGTPALACHHGVAGGVPPSGSPAQGRLGDGSPRQGRQPSPVVGWQGAVRQRARPRIRPWGQGAGDGRGVAGGVAGGGWHKGPALPRQPRRAHPAAAGNETRSAQGTRRTPRGPRAVRDDQGMACGCRQLHGERREGRRGGRGAPEVRAAGAAGAVARANPACSPDDTRVGPLAQLATSSMTI